MKPLDRRRGAARTTPPAGSRLRLDRIIPLCACAAFWLAVYLAA